MTPTPHELISAAAEAMTLAYAPYSHFHVGAALLANDGRIFRGCNIENASYGATICAERAAICSAISTGVRHFTAVAIVGGSEGVIGDVCPPCGICRQVLAEFCSPDTPVYLGCADGFRATTLGELLPGAFHLP